MAERIILDPSEVATGRTELDITPWIRADDGVDWGSGEIAAYMAEAERGQVPVDFRVPNRQVQIPLVLQERGGTAFATFRNLVQAKAALFQRQGGWIKRVTSTGGTVFADIVNATLGLPGSWSQAHRDYDIGSSLSLECIPDFYGAEVDLGDNVETTAAELTFTETGIVGDYSGRCRIVVDEDDAESQLGLIWGLRARYYSAASTARLAYEAEALDPLDSAANAALSGASGGTVVTHGTLSTNWTPVLSTDIGGTAALTHTGTYRWWARVRTTSGTAVQLRSVWDVGDLTLPVENTPWQCRAGTAFFDADLGEVRLDPAPTGTHRWRGAIQAKGEVGNENVSIDRVWFAPVDEGYGVLQSSVGAEIGLSTYSARDEFNQTAGALTGKTAPVGGVWVGAGDADDFSVETTGKTAQRTAVSDSALSPLDNGRVVTLNTNMTVTTVQVDVKATVFPTQGLMMGPVARYVDGSNFAAAVLDVATSTGLFSVYQVVAGTETQLDQTRFQWSSNAWYTIQFWVDSTGRFAAWVFPKGGQSGDPLLVGSSTTFTGTLATGDVGIVDWYSQAGANTRSYDNFAAWVPTTDAVLHASQSAELRTDGVFREDASGTAYGPVSHVVGDLPRMPPGGTTEFFLKASRGDLDQLPDTGIDDISARVYYRPSWLFVPGS